MPLILPLLLWPESPTGPRARLLMLSRFTHHTLSTPQGPDNMYTRRFLRNFGIVTTMAAQSSVEALASGSVSGAARTELEDRIRGALWGLFAGDALASPTHWYYGGQPQVRGDYGPRGNHPFLYPAHFNINSLKTPRFRHHRLHKARHDTPRVDHVEEQHQRRWPWCLGWGQAVDNRRRDQPREASVLGARQGLPLSLHPRWAPSSFLSVVIGKRDARVNATPFPRGGGEHARGAAGPGPHALRRRVRVRCRVFLKLKF